MCRETIRTSTEEDLILDLILSRCADYTKSKALKIHEGGGHSK